MKPQDTDELRQRISGHILVLKSAINFGRELSNKDAQLVAASGLALLEGFLLDLNRMAEAMEFEVIQREQQRRNAR